MLLRHIFEAEIKPIQNAPTDDIKFSDLKVLLDGEFSNAWSDYKNDFRLFRGFRGKMKSGVYDPSTGERRSQNTTNHYTMLFDTNPDNSGWPKRSRAFICTNDEDASLAYGKSYVILPKNGVELGVCPSYDIWEHEIRTEDGSEINIKDMNAIISYLEKTRGSEFTSYTDFESYLYGLSVDEFISIMRNSYDRGFSSFGIDIANEVDASDEPEDTLSSICDTITQAYQYSSSGFELVDEVSDIPDGDHEVWLSGECIVITRGKLDDFVYWEESNEGDD